jgi:hypothetical protein
MEPVPPDVTSPAAVGSWPAPRRSSVIAMISASNFVELGHMSRWSAFTCENFAKASLRKS